MVTSRKSRWALRTILTVGVLAMLGGAPGANASVLTVRQVESTGFSIDSLTKAATVLGGGVTPTRDFTATYLSLNFADPESPATGRFGGDVAFPNNKVGSDDNDFAVSVSGHVIIPSAGVWTFGAFADNGVQFSVGSLSASRTRFSTASLLATYDFPSAGVYPLDMIYYEHTGQSGLELFAMAGSTTDGRNPSFRLVGDVLSGGLAIAPEPTGIVPLALLAALMMRRRRIA